VVEPDSLCWVSGRLVRGASADAWVQEFKPLTALHQVTRDAGTGLTKWVADWNKQRQQQGLAPVADQLDHFHTLREGGRAVGRAERQARGALAAAEKAEAEWTRRQRRGQSCAGLSSRRQARWTKATQAMDVWQAWQNIWHKIKQAVQLVTAEGELNTRVQAEAELARLLPELPDSTFAKVKRLLGQPQSLTYLDQVQQRLRALTIPAEVREAAVRQETLRRRPELLQGDSTQAAALRGVLLVCAVLLAKAGAVGQEAAASVRAIFRTAWRASSLVECVNSALRMQQTRHRKMTQGLLDLKRLYWNTHQFRTGRRRHTTPYERLGIPWPEGLRWWDVLQWTPEQLRQELSALKIPE
jgi:hypothetical protein